jgi:hypothetical protein
MDKTFAVIKYKNAGRHIITMVLFAVCYFLAAQSCHASADPFLDGQMKKIESKIGQWEHDSYLIVSLTYAITVIGAVVALMQKADSKAVKITTAVLAVVSALLVPANRLFFPVDDRTYQKVAKQTRNKLDAFSYQLNQFQALDDATKASLRKKFEGVLEDVDQLEYNTIYNGGAVPSAGSALSDVLLPSARADGSNDGIHPPPWAEKLPMDERNMYFLGAADGKTFDEAHQNAVAEARKTATGLLTKAAEASQGLARKPELAAKIALTLANAAEIAETFTAPNSAGGYRGYVLLRLSRAAGVFAAQSIFVESGVPYDKRFLDSVQKDSNN